jgi:hypothetical protein
MNVNVASLDQQHNSKAKWATIAKFGILRLRIMDLHEGLELRDEMGVRRAQYMNDISHRKSPKIGVLQQPSSILK